MWIWTTPSADLCPCGRRLASPSAARGPAHRPSQRLSHREVGCACGRRAAYAASGALWTLQAVLTPEGSVPVGGFSRALREQPDAERFWFLHPIGGARLPVHVVFSPSLQVAEVKAADLKVLHLESVASAAEARRVWVDRRESSGRRARQTARLDPEPHPRAGNNI